jgi:AcrR family transcriptional regulator
MGPMKKGNNKKPNGKAVKRLLLESGIVLFAEKGYASTSVREIVEGAGVTKPVLYYYFESKEGMFHAILNWAYDQLEIMLADVLQFPGTAFDRFVYFYRHLYKGIMKNRNLFKMVHSLTFGLPQGVPPYDFDRYQRSLVNTLMAIYKEGIERDEVKKADPEEVAMFILGLVDFCFHLDNAHPKSIDPDRPERFLRLAFKGLGNNVIST